MPDIRTRALRQTRRLRLFIERLRLAARIRELHGLLDVPHEVADRARARIDRLARRERALQRALDGRRSSSARGEGAGFCCQAPASPALTG